MCAFLQDSENVVGFVLSLRSQILLDIDLSTIPEDDDFQPVVPGGTQIKKNWEEEDKPEVEAPASWEDADEVKVIISGRLKL